MGLEMGPLSSPGTTSYRFPIVTIGLSLTVLQCSRCSRRTDRETVRIGLADAGLKCIGRQKLENFNRKLWWLSVLALFNVVNQDRVRLLLGWVTVCRQVDCASHLDQLSLLPSVGQ